MLELKGISKIFPGVKALDNVSLNFKEGEIHALLGENGAGKSTLIKIICGIYQPDMGKIILDGKIIVLQSFFDAIKNEISVVNQEIQVIPNSSIAENIMLDKLGKYTRYGKLDWEKLNADAKKYLDIVGLPMSPTSKIADLSAAQKQLTLIAKGLSSNAKVLLLDEPTSSLTDHEIQNLFGIVRKLKENGTTIIFVSHKLDEVLSLCDRISVLRDGKFVGSRDCKGLIKQDIIKMMIGREIVDKYFGKLNIDDRNKVLEVKNLYQSGKFHNTNFNLFKGEILGFYGLVGSGRTELAKILIGEDNYDSGQILINGKQAQIKSMADSLYKYKMGYVTENRKEEGLILEASVKTNIAITIWNMIVNKLFKKINIKEETNITQKMINTLQIKVTDPNQKVVMLSGGNQQKVSIAKWIVAGCNILIIDEPTVGVDVGAKEAIHQLIWNLAKDEGKSIILISSDMPELCMLSRRILVFKENEIVGEIKNTNDKEYSYNELSSKIGYYFA